MEGVAGEWEEKIGREKGRSRARAIPPRVPRHVIEETPTKGLRQVMMYRGKFPAENYTQTRTADLSLKGNRLPFFFFKYSWLGLTSSAASRLLASCLALKETVIVIAYHTICISYLYFLPFL